MNYNDETETILTQDKSILIVINEPRSKKAVALLFTLLLTGSTGLYTLWGYLNNYVASYFRFFNPSIDYSTTLYTTTAWSLSQTFSMCISPFFCDIFGFRIWIMFSCFLLGFFVFISSFFTNYWVFMAFYGIGGGFGFGCFCLQPAYAMMLMYPKQKGMISGLVLAGYTLSPIFWGMVCNKYINPNNLAPDFPVDENGKTVMYYGKEIADRLVDFLRIIGCSVICFSCFCSLFVLTPAECKGKLQFYLEKKWQRISRRTPDINGVSEPLSVSQDQWIDQNFKKGKNPRINSNDLQKIRISQLALKSIRSKNERVSFSQIYTSMMTQSLVPGDQKDRKKNIIPNESVLITQLQTMSKVKALKLLIKTKEFYMLFVCLFINMLCAAFCVFNFSVLAQYWSISPVAIEYAGAIGPLCNSFGSVFGGLIADRFSFRWTMKLISTIHMIAGLTLIEYSRKNWGFIVCVDLFFSTFGMTITINAISCQMVYGHEVGPFALPWINIANFIAAFGATMFAKFGIAYGFDYSLAILIVLAGCQFLLTIFIREEVPLK